MDRLKLSLLGAVAVAAVMGAPAAQAADLLPPPPVVEAPEVVVKKSGWYLRGDISYDFQESRGLHYGLADASFDPHVDDAFNIGLGIGYQVTDNFRVDLTGEYVFNAGLDYTTGGAGLCPGANFSAGSYDPATARCSSDEHSEVSKFKLLGNAYYDIGHFGGFTPYVGAGIGGAYVRYDDLNTTETCTVTVNVVIPNEYCGYGHPQPTTVGVPTTTTDERQDFKGESEWRFAWAVHAGGAYSISDHLKLDVGYTFSRIEGGKAYTLDAPNTSPVAIHDKGFNDHTIRAGLRYHLW